MDYTPAPEFSFATGSYTPSTEFTFSFNIDVIGAGIIGVSGGSVVAPPISAIGAGIIGVSGGSVVAPPISIIGAGIIGVSGGSVVAPPISIIGIGSIGITGLSTAESGITEIAPNYISTRYHCYLDGLELPIKSFQFRINSARKFGSVVVPDAGTYAASINERLNGSLRIDRVYNYSDGSTLPFNMFSITFDSIRLDSGGQSGTTATLSGSDAVTSGKVQTIELYDPTFMSSTNGARRRYRHAIDPRVRPGDTVKINGEEFTAGEIVWYVDVNTAISEISEAS